MDEYKRINQAVSYTSGVQSSTSTDTNLDADLGVFSTCIILCIAFSIGEAALVTSISFASLFFGVVGSWSMSILYFSFTVGSLFANTVLVTRDSSCVSLRRVLITSQITTSFFHLACVLYASLNLQTEHESIKDSVQRLNLVEHINEVSLSSFLLISAAVAGFGIGLAWPVLGTFLTNSAKAMSGNNRVEYRSHSGNLNGIFTIMFIGGIILGHILSAIILKDDTFQNIIKIYLGILLCGIVAALLMILFVHEPDANNISYWNDVEPVIHSFADEVYLHNLNVFLPLQITIEEPKLFMLVGTHITSGLRSGMVLSFIGGRIVRDPSLIGGLLALKMLSGLIITPIFTYVGNKLNSRKIILYVGLGCDLAASIIAMYVNLHDDKDGNNCFNALCGMYCLFGIGFASWQSTASGSIITEIMEDTSSRSVVIASFAGAKVISGLSSSLSFLMFGTDSMPSCIVFMLYIASIIIAFLQLFTRS